MTAEERSDRKSRRELIREYARERAAFNLSDLTEDLIEQGLWGARPARISAEWARGAKLGFMVGDVRGAIKTSRLNADIPEFMALEEGEKAQWMSWVSMNRTQARAAFGLLVTKARQLKREIAKVRRAHRDRFNEDPMDFVISE